MTTATLPKTIDDIIDEVGLESMGVKSLIANLECIILEGVCKPCSLAVNDPWHPDQRLHSLVVAIRRQFGRVESLIDEIHTEQVKQ